MHISSSRARPRNALPSSAPNLLLPSPSPEHCTVGLLFPCPKADVAPLAAHRRCNPSNVLAKFLMDSTSSDEVSLLPTASESSDLVPFGLSYRNAVDWVVSSRSCSIFQLAVEFGNLFDSKFDFVLDRFILGVRCWLDLVFWSCEETPADVVKEINLCDEEVDTSNAEIFAECYKGEESNDANQAIRKSETLDSSICPSNKKPTTKKRKGKADDALDDLVGEIHKYVIAVTEANEEMKGISTYFKKQTESGDRKMKIYDELIELSKFSEQEIMNVGEHILKDEHKIDNFFALPKTFTRTYVINSDEHSAKNVAAKKVNKSLEDVNPAIDSIASRLRKRNIG
ncbi:hypothetical protein ZIOFF_066902 [Zingiber officinale]|uniref:Uncharacterized protein n=1 Tax=Zingiber officinale TaxID=94328 RepID=A0A8J5C7U8_ZINOF|nr:hypothetical protein ZIOFF_066902 [Zingiber officinale]